MVACGGLSGGVWGFEWWRVEGPVVVCGEESAVVSMVYMSPTTC